MDALAPIVEGKPARVRVSGSTLGSWLKRISSLVSVQRREPSLRLCEMLPLGEKRFVAVVEYGAERFVLAATPQRISLLKSFRVDDAGSKQEPNADRNGH